MSTGANTSPRDMSPRPVSAQQRNLRSLLGTLAGVPGLFEGNEIAQDTASCKMKPNKQLPMSIAYRS